METASRRAYALAKAEILSGELPAGALLSEAEFAERLDVSRTPVHEAFLKLETEDLLRLIPRRGAVVVPVPPTEAADILDLRFALETAAVRRLVDPSRDLAELAQVLDASIAEQSALATDRDVAAFAVVDARFHRAIVSAAGNAIADRVYGGLADRQQRMTIGATSSRPEWLERLVREHRRLAAAVHARSLDTFATLLAAHMDSTHDLFHSR